MTTTVLVTRRPDNRYTARALALPEVVATGATADEAVDNLRASLSELRQHSQVIEVDLPLLDTSIPHPWQRFAGMWASDPDWEAFEQILAAERAGSDRVP